MRILPFILIHFSVLLAALCACASVILPVSAANSGIITRVLSFVPLVWSLSAMVMQILDAPSRLDAYGRYRTLAETYGKLPPPTARHDTLCGLCVFFAARYSLNKRSWIV